MEFIHFMEYVCLVVTLLVFCTGIPPCLHMYKSGSTKNVPYEFFVLSVVCCAANFHYGLMISNGTIAFLNGFGLFLQICYVAVYIMCVRSKSWSLSLLAGAAIYLSAFYYFLYNVVEVDQRAAVLGQSAGLVTTVLFLLPFIEIYQNFKNNNADGMPLIMSLGGMSCAVSWLTYGLLLGDSNIYGPNIAAVMVNSLKLMAIGKYGQDDGKSKMD